MFVCICTAMLEARGIPPHLLGSLGVMGSRMQHMLHSKVLSSTNSEFAALCTYMCCALISKHH